jgi:hypothetical protein
LISTSWSHRRIWTDWGILHNRFERDLGLILIILNCVWDVQVWVDFDSIVAWDFCLWVLLILFLSIVVWDWWKRLLSRREMNKKTEKKKWIRKEQEWRVESLSNFSDGLGCLEASICWRFQTSISLWRKSLQKILFV